VIVCYYALGEKDKMKRGFQMLLDCPLNIDDDEKYNAISVSTEILGLLFQMNDLLFCTNWCKPRIFFIANLVQLLTFVHKLPICLVQGAHTE
jgi:hypothetical protein